MLGKLSNLYKSKLHIPFEIEHLLCCEVWNQAIKQKYVIPRSSGELMEAYKDELPRDKSIDSVLDEIIEDRQIRETIANYNPHEDKKMNLCRMVERIDKADEIVNIFEGFEKTIINIQKFFV